MAYLRLAAAIVFEVSATLMLKACKGWELWWLGLTAISFYAVAGFLLAIVLKTMNLGVAYTIWSGVGIALVCTASALIWQQQFDLYAALGILMIFAGTIVITLKSSVIIQ